MKLELSDFLCKEKYPVHWGELDAAKHVNNLVYLKWTETLRVKFCESIGIDTSFDSGTTGIILGAQYCKYIFPMRFPDNAIVGLKVQSIESDRFLILPAVPPWQGGVGSRIIAVFTEERVNPAPRCSGRCRPR